MMVKCVFTHHLSGAIISAAPSHATDQTPLHYIKTGTSLENTTVGMAWEWHGRGLCLKVHWRNPSLKQTLKKPQDVDFVVPFFLGGGGRAKLVFCSPMILKKKVSKNMKKKKPLFPTHPSERKPRCSTRCPASKKATSTSRFSTSEASKSAWPSRFPVAIG